PPRREARVRIKDFLDSLLGIEVKEFEKERPKPWSQYGPKDTVWADVTVFDGELAGHYEDVALDTTVLVRQLKDKVGGKVLGRLYADRDNKFAYTLAPATAEDKALAS